MNNNEQPTKRRQGKTGVWTLVIVQGNEVLATSEWGTNYGFAKAQWLELPIVEESR